MIWLSIAFADPIGHILLLQGNAIVTRDGRDIAAQQGTDLEPMDQLTTDEDAWAIVMLHNDHLVRVDGGLVLPLDRMVLLRAPRAQNTPGDQLHALLVPAERSSLGGMVRSIERIGGWEARMQVASPTLRVRAKKRASSPPFGSSAGAPLPTGPTLQNKPPGSPPPRKDLASEPVVLRGAEAKVANKALHELLAPFQPGQPRHGLCIQPWSTQLGLHTVTKSVEFQVSEAEGLVKSIRTTQWVSPPPCLRDAVLGRPIGDTTPVTISVQSP